MPFVKGSFSANLCLWGMNLLLYIKMYSLFAMKMIAQSGVDEPMLHMSQEVVAGKKADAVLEIENFDGDLPDMEEELKMKLHVFSWDDMDFDEDYEVKVEFD